MDSKILIFRTSISKKQDIRRVGTSLDECERIEKWNVDIEDWEKILRIECDNINAAEIIEMLKEINIHAVELE
jgi:phage terminase large subunit-like protein